MIYFMQAEDGGPIKIGFGTYLWSRISDIQALTGRRILVLGVIGGDKRHENHLHSMFAHLRTYGEWFCDEPELRKFIEDNAEEWDGQADEDLPPDNDFFIRHPVGERPHEGRILDQNLRRLGYIHSNHKRKGDIYKEICSIIRQTTGEHFTPRKVFLMMISHRVERHFLDTLATAIGISANQLITSV